jgi:hypothetical protein
MTTRVFIGRIGSLAGAFQQLAQADYSREYEDMPVRFDLHQAQRMRR